MDLNLFWFHLLGILLTGYAVLDGFDLGVGGLHLLAKDDHERRLFLNSIGPLWNGNEVWLVVFGGALFAAFPVAYASAFSGFYLPFMFVLCALIFRGVAIEFRSKRPEGIWRKGWDVAFSLASIGALLLFGTAVGALLHGVPVGASREFEGTLLDLVHPYSLLVGAFTVVLMLLHGAVFLYGKTEGELHKRVRRWTWTLSGAFFVVYMLTTVVTLVTVPHVTRNFEAHPWVWALVLVNLLAAANIPRSTYRERPLEAFVSSGLTILCLVALFGVAQFPNLLTSSLGSEYTITIYNAASSQKTLGIMRLMIFIGFPFVLAYSGIVYWVFRGKTKVGEHSY